MARASYISLAADGCATDLKPIIVAYVRALLQTGLYGDTMCDVVERLICEGAQRAAASKLIALIGTATLASEAA